MRTYVAGVRHLYRCASWQDWEAGHQPVPPRQPARCPQGQRMASQLYSGYVCKHANSSCAVQSSDMRGLCRREVLVSHDIQDYRPFTPEE